MSDEQYSEEVKSYTHLKEDAELTITVPAGVPVDAFFALIARVSLTTALWREDAKWNSPDWQIEPGVSKGGFIVWK